MDDAEFKFNVFYISFDRSNANNTIFDVDITNPIISPFDLDDIESIKDFISNV